MFDLDIAIAEWRRQMSAAGITAATLLHELESHLRDEVEQQVRSGTSVEQGFQAAVLKMGDAGALQDEFLKAGAEPCPRRSAVTLAAINLAAGTMNLLAGCFALFSAGNVIWRGVRFSAADTLFLTLNWTLAGYGAICGVIAIIAAKRLLMRQHGGIRLTATFAHLLTVEIVAGALLRAALVELNVGSVLVSGAFLLCPFLLLAICRRSGRTDRSVRA